MQTEGRRALILWLKHVAEICDSYVGLKETHTEAQDYVTAVTHVNLRADFSAWMQSV